MNREKVKAAVVKLVEAIFDLGFPLEDCRKIAGLIESCEDWKPDLHTYFHGLWSLSGLADDKPDRLAKRTTKDLENDKSWLEKSFFERWEKYLPAKNLISREFTPQLFQSLKINDKLRELILRLVKDELQIRRTQIVSEPT